MGIIVTAVLYRAPQHAAGNDWQKALDMYYDPMYVIQSSEEVALIDIRAEEAYLMGHIDSAVNIPFKDNDEFVSSVQTVKDKQIVIYGENAYSLIPLQAADELSHHGIEVQILRVGWNEFAFFPSFWMSQDQASTVNIVDYLALPEAESP